MTTTTTVPVEKMLQNAANGTWNVEATEYPDGTVIIGVEATFDGGGKREAKGLRHAERILRRYGLIP